MIDMIILSCGRPELLEKTWTSFTENVSCSKKIRTLFHEDVIDENSNLAYHFAKKHFDVVIFDDPAIKQGPSLDKMISMVKTDYFLSWEDDWIFKKKIDLDVIINLMDKYKEINQIIFHKRKINPSKQQGNNLFIKKEMKFDDVYLTTNPNWGFPPGIWRKSFIMKYWKKFGDYAVWELNAIIKQNQFRDADWMIENVGAYYFGKIGEGDILEHIGHNSRRKINEK